MILQRIGIIVGDAGFEPGTSAPDVWCATNEPPHLLYLTKGSHVLPIVSKLVRCLLSEYHVEYVIRSLDNWA